MAETSGMQRFNESIARLAANSLPENVQRLERIRQFLETGELISLSDLPPRDPCHWGLALRRVMGAPDSMDVHDRRALELMVKGHQLDSVGTWISKYLSTQPADLKGLEVIVERLRSVGLSDRDIAGVLLTYPLAFPPELRKEAIRRYVLALPDEALLSLLLEGSPARNELRQILLHGGPEIEERADQIFKSLAGPELQTADPQTRAQAMQNAMTLLTQNDHEAPTMARSIIRGMGERSVAVFVQYMSMQGANQWQTENRQRVLEICASHLGAKSIDILWAAAEKAEPELRLVAMKHLAEHEKRPDQVERVEKALLDELADTKKAPKFIPMAGKLKTPKCLDRLWELVRGKQKTARAAAAEALASADPTALERAGGMGSDPSKEVRSGGVMILAKIATEPAVDCLLYRIARESDQDIRDAIVQGLRAAGVGVDRIADAMGPLDFPQMRERATAAKKLPEWVSEKLLVPLPLINGETLEPLLVKYMIFRQSRQKEPLPDPEIAPVYKLIDRRHSGDFARNILDAFLTSDAGKNESWAMIVAGILGDNRTVNTLASKVRAWADDFEQRLGEWGIEALALNGSIPALAALHAIAEKYRDNTRRKFAVIGEAAQNAIELAAKRMKLSMDELGDTLLPDLGFEPGRPRIIEAGNRQIEATIGLDFKLAMKDVATGKRAASIPKAAAPEVQAQFKGLGKLLLETAKSQSARLERLMVRGHRWARQRWQELFLEQPILFPFAVRLVWSACDDAGQLAGTFRALPDRTLTGNDDEPYELTAASVSIAHPLLLPPETRDAWKAHLSDYEIEAPFAQMDRPVVLVADELKESFTYDLLKGSSMNGFGFRSRAEKSGWVRGPVVYGEVNSYRKRFDNLGIDAFAIIDGVPVYYQDPGAAMTMQEILFLPVDTTPDRFMASRIKLGEVPAMAFSESVGDMTRIFGKV